MIKATHLRWLFFYIYQNSSIFVPQQSDIGYIQITTNYLNNEQNRKQRALFRESF